MTKNFKTCSCLYRKSDKEYDFIVNADMFNNIKPGDLVIVNDAENSYSMVEVSRVTDGISKWAKRMVVAVHPQISLKILASKCTRDYEEYKKEQEAKETEALIDEFI